MSIKYYYSKIIKKLRGSAIKDSAIHKTSKIESGSNIMNTSMDRYSFCGYNCEISNCEIGSFTSIANGVVIGGGMHPIQWAGTSPVFYKGKDSVRIKFSEFEREPAWKTYIGHDVWIGQNVMIKQGVKIGTGAVIGMGSIVTKDVAPYTIVAGNPAKIIRNRFSENVSDKLLKSEWWLLEESALKTIAKDIKSPEDFLSNFDIL